MPLLANLFGRRKNSELKKKLGAGVPKADGHCVKPRSSNAYGDSNAKLSGNFPVQH